MIKNLKKIINYLIFSIYKYNKIEIIKILLLIIKILF